MSNIYINSSNLIENDTAFDRLSEMRAQMEREMETMLNDRIMEIIEFNRLEPRAQAEIILTFPDKYDLVIDPDEIVTNAYKYGKL